jgi:hypothetical protein
VRTRGVAVLSLTSILQMLTPKSMRLCALDDAEVDAFVAAHAGSPFVRPNAISCMTSLARDSVRKLGMVYMVALVSH